MVNIGLGTALISAVLGYLVVFVGILFLMAIISIFGKIVKKNAKAESEAVKTEKIINVIAPKGVDPQKVAAAMAAIAEMESEA